MSVSRAPLVVAGVDVGGPKKGFHAVALRDGAYLAQFTSPDAALVAAWCRHIGAQLIGVDAPCRWSTTGRARPAERALMAEGIWCFASPTRAAAEAHPKQYFHWMIAGAELFRRLEKTHPLLKDISQPVRYPVCFETFPHAVTCALRGRVVSAKNKRKDRRELLAKAGIALAPHSGIDTVDAALCALTAHYAAANAVDYYGDAESGFIVVPKAFQG
jgi:predicted RNase H-like nuclease